jgi:RNA polymerase sigma-70 factor, ECF subfamily
MGESDEELAARVAALDDAAAFDLLVRRHQSRIRNWMRQLAHDHGIADDLAQEAFIRAWRSIGSFDGRGRFENWLMKIAYNVYLQDVRRRARVTRLSTAFAAGVPAEAAAEDPELADLPRMLAVLSDDERVAMILCYAHGLSHSEIANVTELPVGTVKSHIRRGKIKIQSHFGLRNEYG